VTNDSSIHILNAFPLNSTGGTQGCTASAVGITRGSLDISATSAYILQFAMESTFEIINTYGTNDVIQGPQRNDFIGENILFNYSATPPVAGLPATDQVPINYRLPAGATTGSFLREYLITANAYQALRSSVGRGQVVTVNVTLQVRGALASGQKVNSNKVTFPIQVYNSGFSGICAAGDVRIPSGPCATPGGQDGSIVGCCRDIRPPPTGCPTT
jgi:hypothetical protein